MTVNADPPTIKALLQKTLAKQEWFANPASAGEATSDGVPIPASGPEAVGRRSSADASDEERPASPQDGG